MNLEGKRSSIVWALVAGASIVIVVAGMKAAASILSPIILATILAISIAPLPNWLNRKGLPRWLAQLIAVLLVFVVITGVVLLVVVSVHSLRLTLPQYSENLDQQIESLEGLLATFGIESGSTEDFLSLSSANLLGLIGSVLGGLVELLSGVALTLLVLMAMIIGTTGFATTLKIGYPTENPTLGRLRQVAGELREYVGITTRINLMVGAVDALFLFLLGVDFPVLWGILAFLLGYIPSIGFWFALIPPFLLALFEFGIGTAMIVFIGYILINGGVQNFLQPRWMGAGLNLSPLVIVISLFFWTWVLGPLGALIAVPMTVIVKDVVLHGFNETRGLAIMLGGALDTSDDGG